MEKNKSLIQSILTRVHYKTSLAMVAVFLGMLAFSGYYFFGQNIVNEAEEKQRIARVQMSQPDFQDQESELPPGRVTPEQDTDEEDDSKEKNIGGNSGDGATQTPTPTIAIVPPSASPTATASATVTPSVPITLPASQFVLGDPNAGIAILAYYDFECVHCDFFIKNTLPQIQKEYIDTGTVKIIFKNFPLIQHTAAPIAHNAAMCAADQKQFWPFHDMLFDQRSEWVGKSTQEVGEIMKKYASTLNMDASKFELCVDNNTFAGNVERDKVEGKSRGVVKIPTFIIGEDFLVGAHTFDVFKEVIDAQLTATE